MALRGAFQDVSAQYHTQVALAATRDQLADSEQRAAEEHQLALRLQRAIMAQDEPPVAAAAGGHRGALPPGRARAPGAAATGTTC